MQENKTEPNTCKNAALKNISDNDLKLFQYLNKVDLQSKMNTITAKMKKLSEDEDESANKNFLKGSYPYKNKKEKSNMKTKETEPIEESSFDECNYSLNSAFEIMVDNLYEQSRKIQEKN